MILSVPFAFQSSFSCSSLSNVFKIAGSSGEELLFLFFLGMAHEPAIGKFFERFVNRAAIYSRIAGDLPDGASAILEKM